MEETVFSQVYRDIPSLVDSIDEVVNGIVSTKGMFAEQASVFLQKCLDIFPNIIRSYAEDSMLDYAGDVEYWTSLLNRIIQALQNIDRYKIVDVLYFEAKPSILEYKALLEKMELA